MTPKDVLKQTDALFFSEWEDVNKYIIQYRDIGTKEICLRK